MARRGPNPWGLSLATSRRDVAHTALADVPALPNVWLFFHRELRRRLAPADSTPSGPASVSLADTELVRRRLVRSQVERARSAGTNSLQ
jgi:hypothetical protein